MGLNDKVWPDLDLGRRSNWRKGCVLLRGLTLTLVWVKYLSGILNTLAITNTFQNLNAELEHGFKWQSMTWPWPRQKVKLRKGCAIERSNPKAGVGKILKLYLKYLSSYVHFSKLKCKNLNMGVNDKVRTDLDLYKESNLRMGVYAFERSYPKVSVGQIWKQYLKQLKKLCTPLKT